MKKFLLALPVLALLAACSKSDNSSPAQSVSARYTYRGSSGTAVSNTVVPVSSTDNTVVKLERADLYLSNIKLIREDGSEWAEADSYHLLHLPTATAGTGSLTLKQVPQGTYTGVKLSFGVDSSHNHSLDNRGDLDPANGMAWDWNTGYRFLVMEGKWGPNSTADSAFLWHIGSDANFRSKTVALPTNLLVKSGGTAKLNLTVNLAAFFNGPHSLPPSRNFNVMFDPAVTGQAADNIIGAVAVTVE